MISVPKVLDIKWHESSYNNRNKGVKKHQDRISKITPNPLNYKCDVTNKKIGWLSLTSFEFVKFFDTNMVSDTIDVVHCCHTIDCNYRPQFLLRQHAQPREHLHGNHQKVLWKAQGCHPRARKVRQTKIFYTKFLRKPPCRYDRGSFKSNTQFNKQFRFVLPYSCRALEDLGHLCCAWDDIFIFARILNHKKSRRPWTFSGSTLIAPAGEPSKKDYKKW
jgi:hypothetical protein